MAPSAASVSTIRARKAPSAASVSTIRARKAASALTVAGRGNLGRSLARALGARLVPARTGFRLPPAGILFLAVPDGAVADMARRIASMRPASGLAVVHVSGSLGLDVLDALQGNPRGSFHPLQSFPAPRDPEAFRGITVAVDATTPALLARLNRLARSLHATPKRVRGEERVLYHAAAVFASNFLVASIDEGVRALQAAGWTRREAERALLPLVQGVVENLQRRGVVKALTGPIRRGDVGTIQRHLEALSPSGAARHLPTSGEETSSPSGAARHLPTSGEETSSPSGAARHLRAERVKDGALRALSPTDRPTSGEEASQLYRMLGLAALRIAQEAGLDREAAERTRRALTRNAAATRRRSGG